MLDIATANSRKAKTWRNTAMQWSAILDRMQTTTRTPETVAEYRKMSRDRQADIKDTGGFVGGYCNGGRRSDIRHRSILALDADFARPGLWDTFCATFYCAAAIYSTHKHTPEKPRLRLVLPLSRNVSPDEYQAIARKVALLVDIEQFDDSTYQPQRLMFWPSTSYDGEYIFQLQDGPALDADEILRLYTDWTDVSSWPYSSRVAEVIKKDATRQADPFGKPGLLGAFCRSYPIQDAIETFVPEYAPTDDPNRYTYTSGSTAGGVIVYEDKFIYSFHGTDPCSGQLCNAWDMVRLHKFGHLDADTDPATAATKRPSWAAMVALVQDDAQVKVQLLQDRADDFAEPLQDAPEADPNAWAGRLKITKDGSAACTIDNIVIILQNDPALAGRLRYNDFSHNIESAGGLPWRDAAGTWTDTDDAALRYYLEKGYGLSGKDRIFDAVNVVAAQNRRHPVREYLDSCAWDGLERVEHILVDYLGAEPSAYVRAVTRKALVAAVARIYDPGRKFDYILTLRGRQGLGKSALIRKLGGPWFSDSFTTMQGKDAFEQLQGVWLMEIGELAGMRKAEAESIKLFISKQNDRFRPAYGRRTMEYPRQCVFFGTTNESQFLRDPTGNRRFWVVDTPNAPTCDIWTDLTPEEVRQIWAEAVDMYRAGEELFLSPEMEAEARRVQAAYEEENPKAGIIAEYLERLLPDGWADLDTYARRSWLEGDTNGTHRRETVCAMEIWAEALNGNPDRLDRYAIKEINDILCSLPGWRRMGAERITVKPYGRQRYYKREV